MPRRQTRQRPRFSIVLFTKNGMPFLRDAIASLESQTLDDYEVVIQDCASTDGTAEFLGEAHFPAMQMVSEPDTGLGDAYNRAFARCRGEIVGTLDADNLILPGALEAVDELFRTHRTAAVVYGAVTMIAEDGRSVGSFVPEPYDLGAVMRCELVPPMSTSYFHRARCGPELRGEASLAVCQDFELWLRMSEREVVCSPTRFGATRLSYKSMTRNPENYERFCAEKIAALDGFIADRPELHRERDAAVAGIYCWAAESLLGIEGPGPVFDSYLERAASIGAADGRVRRLQDRATKAAQE